jgi:hypothetical protein
MMVRELTSKMISLCNGFVKGSSIALNSNAISIHYALDLLRNLEKVIKDFSLSKT